MSDTATSAVLKTYKGNCHCGAFRYSVKLPELTSITECNCSICSKKNYKWVYPMVDVFTVERDDGKLKEYRFGKKKLAHSFCSICGTGVLGKMQGAPNSPIGLNTRTLNDVDLTKFEVKKFKGDTLDPPYAPAKFSGTEPTVEIEGAKVYHGGCHCGAVTLAFKTRPLPEVSQSEPGVRECDCSICTRNGTINTYPTHPQVSIAGDEHLTVYSFGERHHAHKFCTTCGVPIYIDSFVGPAREVWEAWPESRQKVRAMMKERVALNARCLDGVEWSEVTVRKIEGGKVGLKYVVD